MHGLGLVVGVGDGEAVIIKGLTYDAVMVKGVWL